MSNMTLGLDLGPTSIGWALIDEQSGRIIDAGVRVFPEGIDRDNSGGEVAKNQARRVARAARRQTARRARRRRKLRDALVSASLLPKTPDPDLENQNPYQLRAQALDHPLTPHQLGRAIQHLAQRRGFQSNRKADRADKARKKETDGMLAEIDQLQNDINTAGHRTLGEYLAHLYQQNPHARIRNRHTQRRMYKDEFRAIWNAQQPHHPNLLTDALRDRLFDIIFYQRDMYWPTAVIGRCELEPRLPRCPRADRRAQRFRMLLDVNNLTVLDTDHAPERPLNDEERSLLLDYLAAAKQRTFKDIRKKLGFLDAVRFNLERGDRTKLLGSPTDAALASNKLLGKAWTNEADESKKNRLVSAILYGDRARKQKNRPTTITTDDDVYIRHLAKTEWNAPDEVAERLTHLDLGSGHVAFSLHAIKKLLPHLENKLSLQARDGTPSAFSEAGYLRPDQRPVSTQDTLPEPPLVTNPIVRQALHQVRKLVNAIVREHGLPGRIHVELAREAKGTPESRKKRSREMRDRERQRDAAAAAIRHDAEDANKHVKRKEIDKYLLWQEQNHTCMYSGRIISLSQLLSDQTDVDHILPRYRSQDNSFMNRVVCFRAENAQKGDRTPHEWLAHADPDKFNAVLQRAASLPFPKANRFRQESVELDDFFARQFVDTTYITTQVHNYLKHLGADVQCTRGTHTATLRWHWGLNDVINPALPDQKTRDDHRHHALDAIVIALTTRSRIQQLARIDKQGGIKRSGEILPEPDWSDFRQQVENAVNRINVSHRPRRRIKGPLHKETLYAPTDKPWASKTDKPRPHAKDWTEDRQLHVARKPVEQLTLNEVDHIRDPAIRRIVTDHLMKHGLEPGRGKTAAAKDALKKAWAEPILMPSGIPIKKVRLLDNDKTATPIRDGRAAVKPGNVHHISVFKVTPAMGSPKYIAHATPMLEAVRRVRNGQPHILRSHPVVEEAEFIFSLSRGEMLMLNIDGVDELYRVETIVSTEGGKIKFRHHCAAGKSSDKRGAFSKRVNALFKLNPRKVTVDQLGKIRWAND